MSLFTELMFYKVPYSFPFYCFSEYSADFAFLIILMFSYLQIVSFFNLRITIG
jgi:hypothetical protein